MSIRTLKNRFLASNLAYKLLIAGSFLTAMGSVLPWYNEVTSRDISIQYFGVTGPLYLVGYTILAISGIIFVQNLMNLSKKKPIDFFLNTPMWQLAGALQSAFLVAIAASVYFHIDFGTGFVTAKTPLYGMFIASIGIIFSSVGAGIMVRNEAWFLTLFAERHAAPVAEEPMHQPVPEPRDHQPVQTSFTPAPVEPQETPSYRIQKTRHGIVTKVETVVDAAKKHYKQTPPDISENFNQRGNE